MHLLYKLYKLLLYKLTSSKARWVFVLLHGMNPAYAGITMKCFTLKME